MSNGTILKALLWGVTGVGAISAAIMKFYDKLKDRKIGILGLPASGKTTLAEFLNNSELPQSVSQTIWEKSYKGKKLADLGITISTTDSRSHQGDMDYGQEKEMLLSSDIILYLFDISKLIIGEPNSYFKKIRNEIKLYSLILKKNAEANKNIINSINSKICADKAFIAIGTHTDTIEEEQFNEYAKTFHENINSLIEENIPCNKNLFIGSLKDERGAEDIVSKIFTALKEVY